MNVLGFIICLILNTVSSSIWPTSLGDITAALDAKIPPAGFAFAIWGLIYALMGVFVVYQALPDSWVPDRNNELIFKKIGYFFFANMILNGAWLVIYQSYTGWGFVLGLIDISTLLATCVYIMRLSDSTSDINITEWISLRGGFSLYSGWVMAATIINVAYNLKYFGVLADPDIPWFDEE